jgi:hypothetical protein
MRATVPEEATSLEIVRDGKVMAKRTAPDKLPAVSITAPRTGGRLGDKGTAELRWRSKVGSLQDPHLFPGLSPTRVVIDYSYDDGRTWGAIYAGPDNGSAVLASSFLSASKRARVRVTVNDGFRSASATSGPFTAMGAPPQVSIFNPVDGLRLAKGSSLYLSGDAFNDQGKRIPDDQLRWYANDRQVATGRQAAVATLGAGLTMIKLVGHDNNGRAGGAQLCVSVVEGRSVAAEPLAKCRQRQLTDPQTGQAISSLPTSATSTRSQRGIGWWWLILVVLLLLLLAAIGSWSLRRRLWGKTRTTR